MWSSEYSLRRREIYPDEARGTPFLTWADSYDNFLSQKEDGDLSYFGTGDTYTVDDDNTEAGIYISADDKAAKVDINVRQYIYRYIQLFAAWVQKLRRAVYLFNGKIAGGGAHPERLSGKIYRIRTVAQCGVQLFKISGGGEKLRLFYFYVHDGSFFFGFVYLFYHKDAALSNVLYINYNI